LAGRMAEDSEGPARKTSETLFWWPVSPSNTATSSTAVGSSAEYEAPEDHLGPREHREPASAVPETGATVTSPNAGQEGKSQAVLPSRAATLARARALSQMAMEDLHKPEARVESSHVQKLREECAAAQSRIQTNVASVAKISDASRALEAQLVDIEDARSRVRHARSIRWADLAVCEKRLELLHDLDWVGSGKASDRSLESGAPGASQKTLIEALELEQEAHLIMRRELGLLEDDLAAASEGLLELRTRLKKETSKRRAAVRQDTAVKHGRSEEESYVTGSDSCHFWIKRVKAAQLDAQEACQRTSITIQCTDVACAKAQRQVQDSLQLCAGEQRELRRQFDTQLKDVEFAISCAEWTLNKPESRSKASHEPGVQRQVQRSTVLLHELATTQKNLRCLARQSKRDLQIIEGCRNVTPSNVSAAASTAAGASLQSPGRTFSGLKRSRSAVDRRRKTCDLDAQSKGELSAELQHMKAERHQMKRDLRECEYGMDRCAAWASVLSDLEDRVSEALLRRR